MNYMQEIDTWLTQLLAAQGPLETRGKAGESEEQWLARVKPEIKARILESYRNGQKACPVCAPRARSAKGRKLTSRA